MIMMFSLSFLRFAPHKIELNRGLNDSVKSQTGESVQFHDQRTRLLRSEIGTRFMLRSEYVFVLALRIFADQ